MKNRVYKIKDKILVRGNENELTEDEILVKEENGSVVLKERVNGEVKDIVVKESKVNPTVKSEISISDNYNESLKYYTSNITEETISLLKDGKEILFENAKVFDRDSNTIAEGKLTLKVIHNEIITYEGMSETLYLSLSGIFELPPDVIPDTPLVKKNIYPVWAMIQGADDYMTMSIGIVGTY